MAEIIRIPGAGEIVGGQFILGRELGRGGFGVVFEAVQTGVERKVAVKMLLPRALEEQAGVVERFKREARLASSLTHPSAVTIYAFGVYDDGDPETLGLPYIAMEYLQGESLQQHLERRGPLPPDEVEAILAQVLGSLAEAHRKGIIHRDIKPDNIFLHQPPGEPRQIKVLDFGISMAVTPDWGEDDRQRLTETGLVTGTAEYMAPEQMMGTPHFTQAIDVYALGCVAYQLLTGRFPYWGQTPVEIAIRHIYDPLPPLPENVAGTFFGQVIHRALFKDPTVRFKNAGQFLEALERRELPPAPEVDAAGASAPAPGAPMITGPGLPPSAPQPVITGTERPFPEAQASGPQPGAAPLAASDPVAQAGPSTGLHQTAGQGRAAVIVAVGAMLALALVVVGWKLIDQPAPEAAAPAPGATTPAAATSPAQGAAAAEPRQEAPQEAEGAGDDDEANAQGRAAAEEISEQARDRAEETAAEDSAPDDREQRRAARAARRSEKTLAARKAETTPSEPAEQPIEKPAEKPVEQPIEKPAEKPAEPVKELPREVAAEVKAPPSAEKAAPKAPAEAPKEKKEPEKPAKKDSQVFDSF